MAVLVACGTSILVAAETAEEVMGNVRKKYEAVKDAEIRFTQHVRFSVANIEHHATGVVLFKKEHKYRVEVEGHTIVTDGTTVWSYSAANNQVLIDHFLQGEQAVTPERILLTAPSDYTATLVGNEKLTSGPAVIIKLVPQDKESFLSSVKVWVDERDWLMRRVELTDADNKVTTYAVDEIRINIGIRDTRFIFETPQGAEVVDLR